MQSPRITSVDIYDIDYRHLKRPHNFIVARVWTDEGLYGIGEVSMIYGDGAKGAAANLRHLAAKYLIGEPADNRNRLWDEVRRQSFWHCGGGGEFWGAVSALDEALWDLEGKRLGLPVHALLGGKIRDELEIYANGWYGSAVRPEEFAIAAEKTVSLGYRALKFDPFRMTANGRMAFPDRELDADFGRLGLARVAAVRKAVGPDVKLMLDLHGMLGINAAVYWGNKLAEYDLFFYEDPIETRHHEHFAEVTRRIPVRVACGDRLYTRTDVLPYLEAKAVHVLQSDVGLASGFSETFRIATMADAFDVQIALHNCAGPINTAASVQLSAAIPNFLIQEFFPFWTDDRYKIVNEALELTEKPPYCRVPDKPGIGVTLNEEYVKPWLWCTVNEVAGRTTA